MLYLPKELYDFYQQQRLNMKVSLYDLFKAILYEKALELGFQHKHRYKAKWIDKELHDGTIAKKQEFFCVICDERK